MELIIFEKYTVRIGNMRPGPPGSEIKRFELSVLQLYGRANL